MTGVDLRNSKAVEVYGGIKLTDNKGRISGKHRKSVEEPNFGAKLKSRITRGGSNNEE